MATFKFKCPCGEIVDAVSRGEQPIVECHACKNTTVWTFATDGTATSESYPNATP